MSIGIGELFLILIIVFCFVKDPEKIPEFMKSATSMINQWKKTAREVKKQMNEMEEESGVTEVLTAAKELQDEIKK